MKYTIDNYEAFALDYIENNLSEVDRRDYEAFLASNPEIKRQLENFQLLVLPSVVVEYPDKNKLYRHKKHPKSLVFYLRNIAAIILLIVLAAYLMNSKISTPDDQLVEIPAQKGVDHHSIENIKPVKENLVEKHAESLSGKQSKFTQNKLPVQNRKKVEELNDIDTFHLLTKDNSIAEDVAMLMSDDREALPLDRKQQTITLIERKSIKPDFHRGYLIDKYRTLIIEEEEIRNETFLKIGRLLAKANLIPTGLENELGEGTLKENMIPETYFDLK